VSLRRGVRTIVTVAALLVTGGAMAAETGEQVASVVAPPVVTKWGTGFFVNQAGDVVTARHVIEGCNAVSLIKDGRSAPALVGNLGGSFDIAVLHSPMKPSVAAVFARTTSLERGDPVFAESYPVLRRMPDAAATLYNGFVHAAATANADHIAISSQAGHGSSGSPVLDEDGLVIGLIDERVAAYGAMTVGARASSADNFVVALSGKAIKSFLVASGVAFEESAEAQLAPLEGDAVRAAAISVAVICH